MICEASKDILKGVEFEGCEASFGELESLRRGEVSVGGCSDKMDGGVGIYQLMAQLLGADMPSTVNGLSLSHGV